MAQSSVRCSCRTRSGSTFDRWVHAHRSPVSAARFTAIHSQVCLFRGLEARALETLSARLALRSLGSLSQDVGSRIEALEDLLHSIEDLMTYQPSLMDEHDGFQELAFACWAVFNLFTAMKAGQWGVHAVLNGTTAPSRLGLLNPSQ